MDAAPNTAPKPPTTVDSHSLIGCSCSLQTPFSLFSGVCLACCPIHSSFELGVLWFTCIVSLTDDCTTTILALLSCCHGLLVQVLLRTPSQRLSTEVLGKRHSHCCELNLALMHASETSDMLSCLLGLGQLAN